MYVISSYFCLYLCSIYIDLDKKVAQILKNQHLFLVKIESLDKIYLKSVKIK
jgi:hypothetical protein